MANNVNDPISSTPAKHRRVSLLTWAAGAMLICGLLAGTVLSIAAVGAATAAPTAAKAFPSKSPKQATATPAPTPVPTLSYASCEDVWAGGQGPFKEGEPGYTKQLDPDGDGIACPTSAK